MIHTSMQKHAGILFISKKSSRVLLILEDLKWTVPSFTREHSVVKDAQTIIYEYYGKDARLVPVELYVSQDSGFEFSTYICLVDSEFVPSNDQTFCWTTLNTLPKGIHTGLKTTLTNKIIKTKIDTILLMENSQ